ncbi:MAG: hypothetical protein AB1714_21240 [Acidobacteriota bacterium]
MLHADAAQVWVDVVEDGRELAFYSRLGILPAADPLPVLRFLTAANDHSARACRLSLRDDIIGIEVVEPLAFVNTAVMASSLGQLIAVAAELRKVLSERFGVEPAPDRFASDGLDF